jgi:hypothetical protein
MAIFGEEEAIRRSPADWGNNQIPASIAEIAALIAIHCAITRRRFIAADRTHRAPESVAIIALTPARSSGRHEPDARNVAVPVTIVMARTRRKSGSFLTANNLFNKGVELTAYAER